MRFVEKSFLTLSLYKWYEHSIRYCKNKLLSWLFGLDINWGAHPSRRLILSAVLCCQDSLFILRAHGYSPFMLAQLLMLCLFRYYLGSHIAEVSWAAFLSFLDTQPHSRLPVLSLTIFPLPFLWCFLSLRHSSFIVDVSVGDGHPRISFLCILISCSFL